MVLFGLPKGSNSYTKTVESGAFIRTKWRKGNKRTVKTVKMTKNEKKVVLGYIGDFEVYVYPFDYPDSVFIGKFPVSTKIDFFHVKDLFVAFNRARWYLEGNWQNGANFTKQAKTSRDAIVSAYNRALNEKVGKK